MLVDRASFDTFALAVTWFMIAITVSRSLTGELLPVVLSGTEPPGSRRRVASEGVCFSGLLGLAVAVVAVAVTIVVSRESVATVMVTAAFFPLITAQDAARFAFFGIARPIEALTIDSLWLIVQLTFWGATFALNVQHDVEWLVTGWGVGATASLVYAWRRIGMDIVSPRHWRKRQQGRLLPCFVDGVLGRGAVRLASILAVGVSTASVLGPFRLARNLLGPPQNLMPLFFSFGVPRARRRLLAGNEASAKRSLTQLAVLMTVVMLGYSAAVAAVVLLWRDPPELWRETLPIVIVLGTATVLQLPGMIVRAQMRVYDRYSGVYGARLITSVAAFTLLPLGAALGGSFGLALATGTVTLSTSMAFVIMAGRQPQRTDSQ